MKITTDLDLDRFQAWSGAVDTLNRVREEGKIKELQAQLEKLYPDGMTGTELNDLLWFDEESIFEWIGIEPEE